MKILKVIVDKRPKSCFDCEWLEIDERGRSVCADDPSRFVTKFKTKCHPDCPLMVDSEVARLREDNERLRTQNKQLLEVVGLMESEE